MLSNKEKMMYEDYGLMDYKSKYADVPYNSSTKGTKGDYYFRQITDRILAEGCWDLNPRPHWKDGKPAHTISINHALCSYDLSKGESPFITLRPVAVKSAIGELLWIYQDQSSDLDLLARKYSIKWWDDWDIGDRTIGCCYGETVRRHDLVNKNLLNSIKNNPDSRYHIINLWQEDDFKQPHGLKPCCYQTVWNVRHGRDGKDYLDMCLFQRSSDFGTAGCINQVQYCAFLVAAAYHFGYEPGVFSWMGNNIQIYDRHIGNIKEMLERESADCNPQICIEPDSVSPIRNFYALGVSDFKIRDYQREKIEKQNPQLTFEVAI